MRAIINKISAGRMILPLIFLLGSIGGVSFSAMANMRAPDNYWPGSSSALSKAAGLKVLGETLLFDCGEESCDVDAIYTVQADRPLDLTFEFMLPVQTTVNAWVAGHKVPTDTLPFGGWRNDRDDPRVPRTYGRHDESRPIYRAIFQGRLDAGANRVEVRYVQPLGADEAAYGYFTTSRWIRVFGYELKPLKEWSLAEDFALDIFVSTPRTPPGESAWSSIFSKKRSIECFMPNPAIIEQDDKIVYSVRLGRDFPDRLICQMGDRDLLPDPTILDRHYQ